MCTEVLAGGSRQAFTPLAYPALQQDEDRLRAVEQARAAGHAAGYAAGLRAAAAETERLRAALRTEHEAALAATDRAMGQGAAALAAAAEQVRLSAVQQARELQDAVAVAALELAEAVLGRELEDHASGAQAALLRVLAVVDQEPVHSVRMHPEDLALLGDSCPAGIALEPDSSLNRGDAIARLSGGYLDATLAAALDRARQVLHGAAR